MGRAERIVIRLGIIGCGAVVQQYHLPALKGVPELTLTGLADNNSVALEQAQADGPVKQAVTDYRDLKDLDAVLIASPHSLHAAMCAHFLEQGIHVLVEKPATTRTDEAEQLIALAHKHKAVLAVGVFRRYYESSLLIRSMIQNNWGDGVVQIDAEEGSPYDWALQSRFLLDRALSGGGVLMDTGSHLLDRLLWWFPGATIHLENYWDDSAQGVEADCLIRFRMNWREQTIACRVELSRTRTLRNTIQITFRKGQIEVGSNKANGFYWQLDGLAAGVTDDPWLWMQTHSPDETSPSPLEYFRRQLADFSTAILTGATPLTNAVSNLPTIVLIESCYRSRQSLPEPWNERLSTTQEDRP